MRIVKKFKIFFNPKFSNIFRATIFQGAFLGGDREFFTGISILNENCQNIENNLRFQNILSIFLSSLIISRRNFSSVFVWHFNKFLIRIGKILNILDSLIKPILKLREVGHLRSGVADPVLKKIYFKFAEC